MAIGPTLAIDLGGTKLLLALVDGGRVVARAEAETDRAAGPEAWVERMAALAADWTGRFARAGITVTGLVKDGLWRALNPGTLAIPGDFALRAAAEQALGVPVTLCNDAQAAAWGEYVRGAGQGRDLVFLTVSTGVGGGVVAGGQLLRGRGGLAGSFGQLLPLPGGEGGRFEDAASGRWIAAEGARRGLPADTRALFAAAERGDAGAKALIALSAARIARLCQDIQLMFDPDLIVIGGGVGLAPGYLGQVEAALRPLSPLLRPAVVPAALGKEAGIIGIADLAEKNHPDREEET